MTTNAIVLLSGGMDSSAALVWAAARYVDARAMGFMYGQPNASAELGAAQRIAESYGTPFTTVHLAEAMLTGVRATGLLAGVKDHDASKFGGIDSMFVPGRNLLFIVEAMIYGCAWWPTGHFDIILGCNTEDMAGFPDCRRSTFDHLQRALCMGSGHHFRIVTPWQDKTKAEILYAIQPDTIALRHVSASWSCYRGGELPCGTCGACVKRAAAFSARGLDDASRAPTACGGDPHREAG